MWLNAKRVFWQQIGSFFSGAADVVAKKATAVSEDPGLAAGDAGDAAQAAAAAAVRTHTSTPSHRDTDVCRASWPWMYRGLIPLLCLVSAGERGG